MNGVRSERSIEPFCSCGYFNVADGRWAAMLMSPIVVKAVENVHVLSDSKSKT